MSPTKKKQEMKHTNRDLLAYVLIAFLGGNTSGGLVFTRVDSDSDKAIKRIEQKVDKLTSDYDRTKECVYDLKEQIREINLINKIKKKN